ncbi:MAG: hypothetical protein WBN69_15040, partial [Eudoraea sp.]
MNKFGPLTVVLLFVFIFGSSNLKAQKVKSNQKSTNEYPTELYSSLKYRLVGPFRGGRSAAVTGVPGEPNLFYFGATGGGVWKTVNGGRS